MTLLNRLTLFSLTALAVVLVAFSATLYLLAGRHLSGRLDERVATTMDTLIALAEIEPDGLDWEPELRRLPVKWEGDPPLWAIYDERGVRIDGSHDPDHRLTGFAVPASGGTRDRSQVQWGGADWRVSRETLHYPDDREVISRPDRRRYRTLVFVAAWPVAPLDSALRTLAWSLTGISMAIWLTAGLVSRWLCRRALAPVSHMKEAARAISASDLAARLPLSPVRDELHDLAMAFNDLLTRLQDSFERQRRFTGDASHQLRTPLAAMLGQMEVALRRDRDPEEYRRVLTTSVTQAVRLRQIVESLLFLARANAEADLPGLETIPLGSWLSEYLSEVWASHPRFHDIRFEQLGQGPTTVYAQPALLGQAVGNLLDNALKYSPPGSVVRIQLLGHMDPVVITVENQGPGIPTDELERIFEPFFRSAEARRLGVPGVGLGLAVTARIVSTFGGHVRASRTQTGSKFEIFFPCQLQSGFEPATGTQGFEVRPIEKLTAD